MVEFNDLKEGDLICFKVWNWGNNYTVAGEITKISHLIERMDVQGFKLNKGGFTKTKPISYNYNEFRIVRRLSPAEYMNLERLYKIQITTREKIKGIFNSWT